MSDESILIDHRKEIMNCFHMQMDCFARVLMQESNTYEYTSMKSLNEPKHGFCGVLARKAKAILEDDNGNGVQNKSEDCGTDQTQTRTSPTSFQVRNIM